jgi:hypothetical protein
VDKYNIKQQHGNQLIGRSTTETDMQIPVEIEMELGDNGIKCVIKYSIT